MPPDHHHHHHGETADLASMAAIAAIMSSEFRRTADRIRRHAITSTASRTDVRETRAIADARSAAYQKAREGS